MPCEVTVITAGEKSIIMKLEELQATEKITANVLGLGGLGPSGCCGLKLIEIASLTWNGKC